MPLSAVELCATALLKIGAQPITSFADDSAEAACAAGSIRSPATRC